MNNSDRPEFVRIINGLAAIYRIPLTKEAYEIWWLSLKNWPVKKFKDAAGYLLKSCQFMPSPYDFEQLRKKGDLSAQEAWSMVLEHAGGAWRSGALGDKTINRAVATLGGYEVIAHTNTKNLGFLERRFRDAYNDFVDSSDVREALPDLKDVVRLQNSSPGPAKKIKKA